MLEDGTEKNATDLSIGPGEVVTNFFFRTVRSGAIQAFSHVMLHATPKNVVNATLRNLPSAQYIQNDSMQLRVSQNQPLPSLLSISKNAGVKLTLLTTTSHPKRPAEDRETGRKKKAHPNGASCLKTVCIFFLGGGLVCRSITPVTERTRRRWH